MEVDLSCNFDRKDEKKVAIIGYRTLIGIQRPYTQNETFVRTHSFGKDAV